jgi:branched-chain amino acid transport system permease protein
MGRDAVAFFVLGLGSGAIYAALAVGVVLTHRASGVINFAHGALSLYVVYLMVELRAAGDLVLPIGSFDLGDEVAFAPALLIALTYAGVQALAVYRLCFAPLHSAPPLAKAVASVGVMLGVQSLVLLRFGNRPRSLAPILPNEPVTLFGAQVPRDRLLLAVAVALGTCALAWWATRTRFGKATRAAAENERGAYLLGLRPRRIALVNWLVAGVVAGLVGIVIAPIGSLEATTFTLLIVPALGAALVGRLSSLLATAAAGLVLGGLQSVLLLFTQRNSWLPQVGLKEGLPFVAIVAIIFLAGKRLPARGTVEQQRLPSAQARRIQPAAIVAAACTVGVLLLVLGPTWRLALTTSMVGAILCVGLVVLTGFVGQISLAHMSLAGVAGFALSRFAIAWDVPFPLAPLLAIAVATAAGVVLGFPALRVRGLHLAVVSIAAAVAIEEFVFKNPDYTGGLAGSRVPQPALLGIDLGIRGGPSDFPRPAFGFLVLIVALVCLLLVSWLRRSELGRRMLAVRGSERAAAAAGIDVRRTKLLAIAVSSAIAGVGGCLLGYQQGQLSYTSFSVFTSLVVLTIAYLGGIASVTGAMAGGALFSGGVVMTAVDEWLRLGRYESVILAAGLVVTAVRNPDGLAGAVGHLRRNQRPEPRRERAAEQSVNTAPVTTP